MNSLPLSLPISSGNPLTSNAIFRYLNIVLKKYNNHEHSSTKYKPNEIFYSNSEELFKNVLNNIKNSFKYISTDFNNFKLNEKCLLNGKIKIQKYYKGKEEGVIIFDKFKQNKVYTKIKSFLYNIYSKKL